MSEFEQRNNSGALFKNTRKETDKHPDFTGTCTVNGKKLEVNGWTKTTSKGDKFLSLAFKEPYVRETAKAAPRQLEEDPFL